jgi:hypothetical protein
VAKSIQFGGGLAEEDGVGSNWTDPIHQLASLSIQVSALWHAVFFHSLVGFGVFCISTLQRFILQVMAVSE